MEIEILEAIQPLLVEFHDVLIIVYQLDYHQSEISSNVINLILGSVLSNRPAYKLRSIEYDELQRQVEDFIARGRVRENTSLCVLPALMVPKKDRLWRMCIDNITNNKINIKY